MNSETIPLGELVNVQTGKLDANASSADGAYPFFTCAREPLQIADWNYDLDAILIAGNGDLNVKHYRGKFDAYQRTYILDVKNTDVLDSRFLFHFMDKYVERLREQSIGGIIKYIKLGMLTEAKIPLPPLQEQKRIAGILDQADTLRRLRTRALDKLNTLGQAIFHEMFGDANEQKICKLSDIAELINGDRSSNYPSGDEVKTEGVLFLNTKNIRDWRLELNQSQFITQQKFDSLSRGKLQRGDIVITLRGTLGQAAIFDCERNTGFINAQMMIIRPKAGITAQYLLDFLALDSTQHELNKGQSGSAVKQLTAKQVGELPVVVPDKTQQSEYARRISSHHAFRSNNLKHKQSLEQLFSSLQHRAFQGDL